MILRINLFIILVILFVDFFTVLYLTPNAQILANQHFGSEGYGIGYFILAFINTLLIIFLKRTKSKKQNVYTTLLMILLIGTFIYFGFSFFSLQCVQCAREV